MLGFRRIKRVFSLYLFFDFEMKQLCVFFFLFLLLLFFRYLVDIETTLYVVSCVTHNAVITKNY